MTVPDEAVEAAYVAYWTCDGENGFGAMRVALEAAMPRIRREIADLELSREDVNRIIREGGSSEWNAGYDAAIIDVMRLLGEEI